MSGDIAKNTSLSQKVTDAKSLPLLSGDDFCTQSTDERSKVCNSKSRLADDKAKSATHQQPSQSNLTINDKIYQVASEVISDSETGELTSDSENQIEEEAPASTVITPVTTRKPSTDLREVVDKAVKKAPAKTKKKNKNKEKEKEKEPVVKKKKKRRANITICTSNCRYEVIRRTAAKFGLREVGEDDLWNLYWTDLSITIERAKDMKRFQKVNHFPGMLEICRKDLLARNLNRMAKLFPKEYNIFPRTWCLPADLSDAMTYSRMHKHRTYILKPDTGSQGRGIYLTKNLKDIKPYDRMICQLYISRPLLVDGYKFDLRVYALITSCDPLRMYVYEDGLVRFATSRYKEPCGHNTTNVFMHLTNYAVNKHSRTYVVDSESGSKRKISQLNKDLTTRGIDLKTLWTNIDDVIVKTMISAIPILRHSYNACFKTHDYAQACFEILGFDILIDAKMKPYVLEVNHSPSFHTDTQIDREIKESLLYDTFSLLNMTHCDKRKVIEEDRKRVRDRLLQGINKDLTKDNPENVTAAPTKKDLAEMALAQARWEDSHIGGYRRVYPVREGGNKERFEKFFQQTEGSSLFGLTVSHRVRMECSRAQREEMELRARAEAAKCLGPKSKSSLLTSEGKTNPSESPTGSKNLATLERKLRNHTLRRSRLAGSGLRSEASSASMASRAFEPEPIIDSEERERLSQLAQRDFLIRSYGLVEHIYLGLQKMGAIRQNDERKYGMHARVQQQHQHQQQNQQHPNQLSCSTSGPQTARSSGAVPRNANALSPGPNKGTRGQPPSAVRNKHADLKTTMSLQCNEIQMYPKKEAPYRIWPDDLSTNRNANHNNSKTNNAINSNSNRDRDYSSSASSVRHGMTASDSRTYRGEHGSMLDMNSMYQKIRANSKRYN